MLFVSLFNARPGTMVEATKRRLDFHPPENASIKAEYWLPTPAPRVILVFEAENESPVMHIEQAWDDLFDVSTFPAMTAEEGLHTAREHLLLAGAMAR